MGKLTPKQERFVDEFLMDCNGRAAARRAGYSAKTATEQAHRLLNSENVQARLAEKIEERAKRTGIEQDKVVLELAQVAFAEASDEPTSALRYASKLRALELLGKHLGMFSERVRVEADSSVCGVVLLAPVMPAGEPPADDGEDALPA